MSYGSDAGFVSPRAPTLSGRPALCAPRPRGARDERHRQTVVVAVVFVVLVVMETATRFPPRGMRQVILIAERASWRSIIVAKRTVFPERFSCRQSAEKSTAPCVTEGGAIEVEGRIGIGICSYGKMTSICYHCLFIAKRRHLFIP